MHITKINEINIDKNEEFIFDAVTKILINSQRRVWYAKVLDYTPSKHSFELINLNDDYERSCWIQLIWIAVNKTKLSIEKETYQNICKRIEATCLDYELINNYINNLKNIIPDEYLELFKADIVEMHMTQMQNIIKKTKLRESKISWLIKKFTNLYNKIWL